MCGLCARLCVEESVLLKCTQVSLPKSFICNTKVVKSQNKFLFAVLTHNFTLNVSFYEGHE